MPARAMPSSTDKPPLELSTSVQFLKGRIMGQKVDMGSIEVIEPPPEI